MGGNGLSGKNESRIGERSKKLIDTICKVASTLRAVEAA